jgi:hypothetical protein
VLGEPAFVPAHHRGDAQREALLAEQSVAAVAAAERPDRTLFRKVADVRLLGIARPGHVLLTGRQRRADRVEAAHKVRPLAQRGEDPAAHARHRLHAHRDVGRVGDLNADLGDG